MKFASLSSSNNAANYVAAGKAASKSAANIFNVQRKTGPDYTGLITIAQDAKTKVEKAGINAAEKFASSAVNTLSNLQTVDTRIKQAKELRNIKNDSRKAGVLGAVGKMVGAGYLATRDNTKGRERPKGDYKGLVADWEDSYKALKDRHAGERDALGEFTPTPYKSKPFNFDTTSGGDSGKVTNGSSKGEPSNVGQAYMTKLTNSGFTNEQAAAMVGHLKVESDNFRADTEYAPNRYGTKGRGHLQWTDLDSSGGRRTNFEAWSKANNLSPTSFEANSGFLLSELQGNHGNQWTKGSSLQGFKNTKSVEEASAYLQNNYIRPGNVPHTERRLSGAYTALENFNL